MTTIELNLPDEVMQKARQAAAALQRPVEEVLADLLAAVLPPVHDGPPEMYAELTGMAWLANDELWDIAQGTMSAQDQERFSRLAREQAERELTSEEEQELNDLRREYGRTTLLKARAYALLSLRGGKPVLREAQ